MPSWGPYLQDFNFNYFSKISSSNIIKIRIWEIELLVHELLERRFILTSPKSNSVDSQNPYPHMHKTPILTFRANKNKMKGAWVSQSRIEETPLPTAAREEGRELEQLGSDFALLHYPLKQSV